MCAGGSSPNLVLIYKPKTCTTEWEGLHSTATKGELRGIFQSRVGALNGVNSPKPPTELMSEKSDQWVSRWVGQ